jgi:formate dehydrogenase gamma subunit
MEKHSDPALFRRFQTSEIILHWVNAIPFLILLLTGALMIYSRFYNISANTLELLRYIHKIFAVVWTVLLGTSFFAVGTRLNLSNLREFFRMGSDDVKWIYLAFKSIFDHSVEVPPAGKFNTGQKINSLLVFFYSTAFPITGVIMWFFGTILIAWYVHAAIFFMAATTVSGHLYLSFINPSTRVGLWGIFHGWVPKSYVAHHHSLTLGYKRESVKEVDPDRRKPDPKEKKLKSSMFMSAEVVIFLLTIVLGIVGLIIFKQGSTLGKEFNAIIRPNQLSKAHRIKELTKCTACHEYTGELKDEKCMDCHRIIKKRMEEKLGYHGNNKGKCIKCHREHPPEALGKIIKFEKEKFDHKLALFKLEGKHAEIKECEKCHKARPKGASEGLYVGMKYELCTDCHKDPHNNALGAKCEQCHTDKGWKGKDLKFDHNKDSKYKLEGKHTDVKCIDCHKPTKQGSTDMSTAVFKGMKFNLCTDCHKDPHNSQFKEKNCTTCHSTKGWRGKDLIFDHSKDSKYKVEDKHKDLGCAECHVPDEKDANAAIKKLAKKKPAEKPKKDVKYGNAQFVNIKYKLCTDCHEDQHNNQFKDKNCTPCHTIKSWREKDLKFDHNKDSKYKIEDKHKDAACTDCHIPDEKDPNTAIKKLTKKKPAEKPKKDVKYGNAQFVNIKYKLCTDCHEDPHNSQFKDKTCTPCHTIKSWKEKDLNFDHNKDSKFKLEGKHKESGCADCHVPDEKDANAAMRKLTKLPKKKTTEEKPKKDIRFGTAQLTDIKFKLCTDCHEDPHKNVLGANCDYCHGLTDWKKKKGK